MVRDDASMGKVLDAVEWQVEHFEEIPVLVVACLRGSRVPLIPMPPIANTSYYGSIYPSVQNLLLAARAMGLGASLITLPLLSVVHTRRILDLPMSVTPACIVPLGWPRGRYGPTTRRPVGEVVHLDRFGQQPWKDSPPAEVGYGRRIETTTPDQLIAGRWQLRAPLGRGAMADVHDAEDVVTGLPVAVKVLRSVESDHLQRFERELDALRALDHPAVVALLDHGEHDGRPFLVLERCDGGTLAEALAADGPFGPDRAASIGAELADGLAHAHARGVVHRDVKPSNVLLCADGTAKLADFGIARLHDASALTGTGFTIGTAAYLAPEQARGEAVGPAADVYSLGLLVLEMATGRRAFEGVGMAAAMARLHHGPEIPDDLPLTLAATVTAMAAMDPDERPTAEAVASQLRQPEAVADLDEADGTAVLPILADPTEVVPALAPDSDTAAGARRGFSLAALPRWALPVACFAIGFVVVLLLGIAVAGDDGGGGLPTTTTAVPTTTATTAAPPPPTTAAPPVNTGGGGGGGNGHGHGHGHGDG
jgi:aminoglycoside phosphotransferase (APT) family kinase protein